MNGWYPKWSPDGTRIISGAGALYLNGQPLGLVGHEPVWRDTDRIVFHTDRPQRGTFQLDLRNGEVSKLDEAELIELAAGGDLWAGRLPGVGLLVFGITSGKTLIKLAGQPSIAQDGALIYRQDDNTIEPSICRAAAAWGDGKGRIHGYLRSDGRKRDLTVAGPEARPRVFDTPDGPWLLTMWHRELRVRKFGESVGYARKFQHDNQNLHADVIYADGVAKVAYQDGKGSAYLWLQPLSAHRKPFDATGPVPDDGETPDMPVNVPNLKPLVERVRARYPTPLGAQHARFLAEFITIAKDETKLPIGLLKKAGGTVIKMPSGVTVSQDVATVHQGSVLWTYDFLGSGETKATPAWNRTKPTGVEKDISKFYDVRPSDLGEPVPQPEPEPEPEPPPPADDTRALIVELGRHLGAWQ